MLSDQHDHCSTDAPVRNQNTPENNNEKKEPYFQKLFRRIESESEDITEDVSLSTAKSITDNSTLVQTININKEQSQQPSFITFDSPTPKQADDYNKRSNVSNGNGENRKKSPTNNISAKEIVESQKNENTNIKDNITRNDYTDHNSDRFGIENNRTISENDKNNFRRELGNNNNINNYNDNDIDNVNNNINQKNNKNITVDSIIDSMDLSKNATSSNVKKKKYKHGKSRDGFNSKSNSIVTSSDNINDSIDNTNRTNNRNAKPNKCELILESSLLFYNQHPSLGCLRQTTVSAVNTAAAPSKIMGDNDLLGVNMLSNTGDDGASTIITSKYPPGLSTIGMSVAGAPPSTTATAVAAAAAANAAGVPKRPIRRGGKAQPDRPIRALFCLGLKNPFRKLCIDIVEWKYPFLNNNNYYQPITFFFCNSMK